MRTFTFLAAAALVALALVVAVVVIKQPGGIHAVDDQTFTARLLRVEFLLIQTQPCNSSEGRQPEVQDVGVLVAEWDRPIELVHRSFPGKLTKTSSRKFVLGFVDSGTPESPILDYHTLAREMGSGREKTWRYLWVGELCTVDGRIPAINVLALKK